MKFNIQKFTKILEYIFPDDPGLFSLEDTMKIFKYYFEAYEKYTGKSHPPINRQQIEKIICDMPIIFDYECDRSLDLYPDDYEAMIDKYFETDYGNCDYNINHFFSGRIREIKYFETC